MLRWLYYVAVLVFLLMLLVVLCLLTTTASVQFDFIIKQHCVGDLNI